MQALQWIMPFIIGALGALVGVYYRESFSVARKVKLFSARLDVLLTEFEYEIYNGELKPIMELGSMIPILSKQDRPPKQTPESRAKTYQMIREKIRSDTDIQKSLNKVVSQLELKTHDDLVFDSAKAADSYAKFEKAVAFTNEPDFMALPFHVVFQRQRFTTTLGKVSDATSKLYNYAESKRFAEMRSLRLLDDLLMNLTQLMEVEYTLSKNIRSYRNRNILSLTFGFMLSGRVR